MAAGELIPSSGRCNFKGYLRFRGELPSQSNRHLGSSFGTRRSSYRSRRRLSDRWATCHRNRLGSKLAVGGEFAGAPLERVKYRSKSLLLHWFRSLENSRGHGSSIAPGVARSLDASRVLPFVDLTTDWIRLRSTQKRYRRNRRTKQSPQRWIIPMRFAWRRSAASRPC
jgi:hypothetical protein